MSEVAVTDMSGGVLTDILTDMQQATNRGTFELEGTTKLGQHLDDGLEHTEFYLDKMAIVKTLKDLYNERTKLYEKYCHINIKAEGLGIEELLDSVAGMIIVRRDL